jgi:hypothetical protein
MKTQREPPITVRTWAKVLVFGGVTAAALIVLLGVGSSRTDAERRNPPLFGFSPAVP